MMTFFSGELVTAQAQFYDLNGVPVDPTTVTLLYRIGSAASTPLGYPGGISRVAVGVYIAAFDSTNLTGVWTVKWISTGLGQSVSEAQFEVQATML